MAARIGFVIVAVIVAGCASEPLKVVGDPCAKDGTLTCAGDRALLCVQGKLAMGVEGCPYCQRLNAETAVACRQGTSLVPHAVADSVCDASGEPACSSLSEHVLSCMPSGKWMLLSMCAATQRCRRGASGLLGCVDL